MSDFSDEEGGGSMFPQRKQTNIFDEMDQTELPIPVPNIVIRSTNTRTKEEEYLWRHWFINNTRPISILELFRRTDGQEIRNRNYYKDRRKALRKTYGDQPAEIEFNGYKIRKNEAVPEEIARKFITWLESVGGKRPGGPVGGLFPITDGRYGATFEGSSFALPKRTTGSAAAPSGNLPTKKQRQTGDLPSQLPTNGSSALGQSTQSTQETESTHSESEEPAILSGRHIDAVGSSQPDPDIFADVSSDEEEEEDADDEPNPSGEETRRGKLEKWKRYALMGRKYYASAATQGKKASRKAVLHSARRIKKWHKMRRLYGKSLEKADKMQLSSIYLSSSQSSQNNENAPDALNSLRSSSEPVDVPGNAEPTEGTTQKASDPKTNTVGSNSSITSGPVAATPIPSAPPPVVPSVVAPALTTRTSEEETAEPSNSGGQHKPSDLNPVLPPMKNKPGSGDSPRQLHSQKRSLPEEPNVSGPEPKKQAQLIQEKRLPSAPIVTLSRSKKVTPPQQSPQPSIADSTRQNLLKINNSQQLSTNKERVELSQPHLLPNPVDNQAVSIQSNEAPANSTTSTNIVPSLHTPRPVFGSSTSFIPPLPSKLNQPTVLPANPKPTTPSMRVGKTVNLPSHTTPKPQSGEPNLPPRPLPVSTAPRSTKPTTQVSGTTPAASAPKPSSSPRQNISLLPPKSQSGGKRIFVWPSEFFPIPHRDTKGITTAQLETWKEELSRIQNSDPYAKYKRQVYEVKLGAVRKFGTHGHLHPLAREALRELRAMVPRDVNLPI